jgi:hypothetical protein
MENLWIDEHSRPADIQRVLLKFVLGLLARASRSAHHQRGYKLNAAQLLRRPDLSPDEKVQIIIEHLEEPPPKSGPKKPTPRGERRRFLRGLINREPGDLGRANGLRPRKMSLNASPQMKNCEANFRRNLGSSLVPTKFAGAAGCQLPKLRKKKREAKPPCRAKRL